MNTQIEDLDITIVGDRIGLHNSRLERVKFSNKDEFLDALIKNGKAFKVAEEKLKKSAEEIREIINEYDIKQECLDESLSDNWWKVYNSCICYTVYKILSNENSFLKEKYMSKLEYSIDSEDEVILIALYELPIDMNTVVIDRLSDIERLEYINSRNYKLLEKAYDNYFNFILKIE